MARSEKQSIRIPHALWDAVEELRQPGRPLSAYPSRNAAIVGLIAYAVAFPRPHQLTAALAKMTPEDQDIVHDFLLKAAREGINLREVLPKPATAAEILNLAKSNKLN